MKQLSLVIPSATKVVRIFMSIAACAIVAACGLVKTGSAPLGAADVSKFPAQERAMIQQCAALSAHDGAACMTVGDKHIAGVVALALNVANIRTGHLPPEGYITRESSQEIAEALTVDVLCPSTAKPPVLQKSGKAAKVICGTSVAYL